MSGLVYGIGVYEKGQYPGWVGGKITKEYALWMSMLSRCNPGGIHQQKYPSYLGCSVHQKFTNFQEFAEWCHNQIGFGLHGWALDKDILIQGNKVYGPDTCVFVPQALNKLLTHKQSHQGKYPTGVSWHTAMNKFVAQANIDGVRKPLGYFETTDDAEHAYKTAKTNEIRRQAGIWKSDIDPRVYEALLQYKI